jgi:putative hemolysin
MKKFMASLAIVGLLSAGALAYAEEGGGADVVQGCKSVVCTQNPQDGSDAVQLCVGTMCVQFPQDGSD